MEAENTQMSGWMRKKGGRMWGDRYFVLKGPLLMYYVKETDTEPKGVLTLNGSCTVSELRSDMNKKRNKQFVFKVSWPLLEAEDIEETRDEVVPPVPSPDGPDKSAGSPNGASRKRFTGGGKKNEGKSQGYIAAGMSYFWGSSSNTAPVEKEKSVILACEDYNDALRWVQAIQQSIMDQNSFSAATTGDGTKPSVAASVAHHPPPTDVRLNEVEEWVRHSSWKVFAVADGVRVLENVSVDKSGAIYGGNIGGNNVGEALPGGGGSVFGSSVGFLRRFPPCLRVNLGVSGNVADVFMTVMNLPPGCRTGVVKSLRIVESIDNCTDIIHVALEPIYVYPTWTAPRDFCLLRYWRQNHDGSYVVCLDSTVHHDCALTVGYIRAELHAAYIISPPKDGEYEEDQTECLLTFIAQMDPKGWIWQELDYQHKLLQQYMMHLLDVRDYLDSERFVQVQFDAVAEERKGTAAKAESETAGTMGTIPPPVLPLDVYSDIDGSTFRVRGLTYMIDKVKTASAPCLFKLVCVDMFEVMEPIQNICSHPRNRVAMALERGDKTWVFVLNIMVPGPPFYNFVVYMEGDPTLIEQDSPFGRIAKRFFHGNDDEFRNNRFKLIPKVIDGNMIIKMAVKDTPTLLGNKLKQYYHKGENYFEIDVDVGSSSIARNVVGLAIGYSKNIVVDIGMCLQGEEENELPEVLMGGCTCIHIDCSKAKKL